jgi:hypothetical protein
MADFDKFVESQFLPHVEAWYELGLSREFEHIEPRSAVGRIAVELHQTLLATAQEQAELGWQPNQQHQPLYDDEIEAAGNPYELAEVRHRVFAGMYYDIATAQGTTVSYQDAVSEALERGIIELDRMWIPPGSKPELLALSQEISGFLSLESDLHFRDID